MASRAAQALTMANSTCPLYPPKADFVKFVPKEGRPAIRI
jgi:hypothetical protein